MYTGVDERMNALLPRYRASFGVRASEHICMCHWKSVPLFCSSLITMPLPSQDLVALHAIVVKAEVARWAHREPEARRLAQRTHNRKKSLEKCFISLCTASCSMRGARPTWCPDSQKLYMTPPASGVGDPMKRFHNSPRPAHLSFNSETRGSYFRSTSC